MSRVQRVAVEELPKHLEAIYAIRVAGFEELDLGVYRVDLADGASWIARLLPAERPIAQTRGDAEIRRVLAELEFPAERCAADEPVSVLEGQAVLVTEFVRGVPRSGRRETIRSAGGLATLGWLLGRLHTLPIREATLAPAARGTTSPTAHPQTRSPQSVGCSTRSSVQPIAPDVNCSSHSKSRSEGSRAAEG